MYSEEEPELRDLIIQNLENCGFLNKIKAEVRAGVLLALKEDGNFGKEIPLLNEKFDAFVDTFEGKLVLSLVREFLEFFSLNFTLSVFDPEVSSRHCVSRSDLYEKLNLQPSEINGPVISALLNKVIGSQNQNSSTKASNGLETDPEKHTFILNETEKEKSFLDSTINRENIELNKEKSPSQSNVETDCISKSCKEINIEFNSTHSSLEVDVDNNATSKVDILKEKSDETKKDNQSIIFKELKDVLSPDHDPFFDEPLPSEKTSFLNFSETLKDKSENKLTSGIVKDLDESNKSSLSSLRDLPSLITNHEWAFTRDSKSNLPSLDLLNSFSSSEISSEQINLNSEENFERKVSDIVESNEEPSEKQNSEESIEEEIEEDFSVGMDDLLNSSLSLGDDVTTDQTVSQISVVEDVDHIEHCNT